MHRVDYRMGHPGLESQQGPRILSSPKCPNRLWGHPSSYSVGTEILSTAVNRPRRMADHSYLAQRLIISGAVPPFPLYTVMACIGTTFIFYTHTPKSSNETQNWNRHTDQAEVFAFYLSPSRQMPSQYLWQVTTASFQILSHSSLNSHPTLRYCTILRRCEYCEVSNKLNSKGHRSVTRESRCCL